MEKLTIEHLAPYLPYKVNTQYQLDHVVSSYPKELRNKILVPDSCTFVLSFCKPILRPLSDLVKDINVNGEKFIPIERINENSPISDYYTQVICGELYLLSDHRKGYNVLSEINPKEKLLKWHFDVFGLIEKGLAIDINTIK